MSSTILQREAATDGRAHGPDRGQMSEEYERVRSASVRFCEPLATEDYVIQVMTDVSPTKWHLAHTTWFFEQFILQQHIADYEPYHPQYYYLFNSYYNGAGPMHCRPRRGLLSRPTVDEVYAYRREVDRRIGELLGHADDKTLSAIRPVLTLGRNHEQQHQELMVTDLKYSLAANPMLPPYRERPAEQTSRPPALEWIQFDEGLREVGFRGEGFCFDNELPRHRVFLEPFALASRPVTNGEYLAFIEDGGYERHDLWLSMGFATVKEAGWAHPVYWYRDGDQWMQYTLAGAKPMDVNEPLSHISYFEADAYARWAGCRLPTEFEWEAAAGDRPIEGNFHDEAIYHPQVTKRGEGLLQLFGDLWEWTSSSYGPYPGYQPLPGTLGEYNGKFMCNQYVLRGGSCATPRDHLRRTYRNFFSPESRWQFTGIRLAKGVQQ